MNYDNWRNSEKVKTQMLGLALRLGGTLDAMVTESIIENLLLSAWIDGTGQGAAEEAEERESERSEVELVRRMAARAWS